MKNFLILFLLFAFSTTTKAQLTSTNPDTVCYHSSGSIYQVTNNTGNTYTWTIASPGVITTGQGTNSITVDWSNAAPGLIITGVSVYATNSAGCQSPPVNLNVFVLNIIPTISPINLCVNAGCVTLSGTPAGGIWSGIGVSGNQFCPSVAGVGNASLTYTYSLAGCTFTSTGIAVVNPLPTITPITHD